MSAPELLLEQLTNTEFISDGKPCRDAIAHAPIYDLLDFAQQSIELTAAKEMEPTTSIFTHTASIGMGGGRFPCSSASCRLDRIEELAQFAALYSEKIFIKNFFSDHLEHLSDSGKVDEDSIRQSFSDDLEVIIRLLPFIERGIIVPITPPNYCAHCLVGARFGDNADKRIDLAYNELLQGFRSGIEVSIKKEYGIYSIAVDANEKLMEHGSGILMSQEIPRFLEGHPRLRSRLEKGEDVSLSTKILRESRISEHLANKIFQSIIFELAASQCLNTSYLTNRDIDVEFLQSLSTRENTGGIDHAIERNITALVPFLGSVNPVDLLALREADQDSFILFRQALKGAVAEFTKNSNRPFSQRDAQAVYGDIIAPELAKISKKLDKAKSTLQRHAGSTVLGWTAALSVGAYTGFSTGGVAEAATALGLTKVLATLIQKLGLDTDTESAIRDEDLYFLWKVKRHSEK